MQVFISHSTSDKSRVAELEKMLRGGLTDLEVFRSSAGGESPAVRVVDPGRPVGEAIFDELRKADLVFAVITPDYVRSVSSLGELASAVYDGKELIPLVLDASSLGAVAPLLGGRLYVSSQNVGNLVQLLRNKGLVNGLGTNINQELTEWFSQDAPVATRPYIGGAVDQRNLLDYCHLNGIQLITDSNCEEAEFEKLDAAKEITIVSTTGQALLKVIKNHLVKAVRGGTDLTVLIPNKNSSFILDVAEIEYLDSDIPQEVRLEGEFDQALYYLAEILQEAQRGGLRHGRVRVGNAFSLLRQTFIAARLEDDSSWAWMSMTMPPLRTINRTTSFLAADDHLVNPGPDEGLATRLWKHARRLRELASQRQELFDMDVNPPQGAFSLESRTAREKWLEWVDIAKTNMQEHARSGTDTVLIEVSAQHPLVNGRTPNREFRKRLDQAAQLFYEIVAAGGSADIYVPGSRHRNGGVSDFVSLSAAGVYYLISKGIPVECLLGDEANEKYKGAAGVYNSADEAFVATRLFLDNGYGRLISIVSNGQMLKKLLFYVRCGAWPSLVTVEVESGFHDPIRELFDIIPDILSRDHDLQSETSEYARKTREERVPID